MHPDEIARLIHEACGDDNSTAMLTQVFSIQHQLFSDWLLFLATHSNNFSIALYACIVVRSCQNITTPEQCNAVSLFAQKLIEVITLKL